MKLVVGTRGSRLAMVQTRIVTDLVCGANSGVSIEPKVIRTLGDVEQKTPLYEMDGGIFEKEIDAAVIGGEVDFAVHSLKDLPTSLPKGIVVAAVPKRASPNDALVSRGDLKMSELRKGAVVGTSSIIRMAELKRARSDIVVKDIRGNVETRIAKMDRGEYDAVLLAEAGIDRLGLSGRIAQVLPLDTFTPAAGQGALAVVASESRDDIVGMLGKIDDERARAEITAERSAISVIGGGCESAVGVIGRANGGLVSVACSVFSIDGKTTLSHSMEGPADDAERIGKKVGKALLEKGADKMIKEWHTGGRGGK